MKRIILCPKSAVGSDMHTQPAIDHTTPRLVERIGRPPRKADRIAKGRSTRPRGGIGYLVVLLGVWSYGRYEFVQSSMNEGMWAA